MAEKSHKNSINVTVVFVIAVFTAIIISAFTIQAKAAVPGGIIDDAVYALQNKATGEYLDIQNNSPLTGKYMIMNAYTSTPSTSEERSALFKFSHVGLNGYIIRTMRNNGVTFYRNSDTAVKTTLADPVDGNNSSDLYWYLSDDGNGYYYLQASNTQKYLCAPTSGVNCTTESSSLAGDRAKWTLIKYTGPTIKGLMFFTSPSAVYMESQTQYDAYMWTTDMSNNGPVTWSVYTYGDWSQPCSSTITNTGLLQTNAVYETLAVCARANLGVVYTKQVTVNPPIQTGLYSIRSTADSNLYMEVIAASYKPNIIIQQYDFPETNSSNEPHKKAHRAYLYKVEWTGESNKYIIRTMTNNANGFKAVSNTPNSNIKTCQISSTNPGYWYITRVALAGGTAHFIIRNGSSSSPLAIGVKYSTETNTYESEKYLELTYYNNIEAQWDFIEPENLQEFSSCRVSLSQLQIIDSGSSIDFSDSSLHTNYFYSTDLNANTRGSLIGYDIESPSGDTSNIASINNGYLTGISGKAGMVSVTVKFSNANSAPINIYFKPPTDEYFFLQNTQGGLGYLESNGTYLSKEAFDYDDKKILKLASLYPNASIYYIQDFYGNYLTAPSSALSGENIELMSTQINGIDATRQYWIFYDISQGSNTKKLKSMSMQNCWVSIDNNGVLIQSNTDIGEFNLVRLGNDVVYHRTFEDFSPIDISNIVKNLSDHYDSFELVYLQNHLGNNEVANDPNACFNIALSMIDNSKIIVLAGHGSPSVITVSETNYQHYLRNTHIYDVNNDFSNVDIIIFDGCSTAGIPDGGLYNMPDSAAAVGAKVAIGWTETVCQSQQMKWLNKFFELMNSIDDDTNQMYTAAKAVDDTNEFVGGPSGSAVISGTYTNFSFN